MYRTKLVFCLALAIGILGQSAGADPSTDKQLTVTGMSPTDRIGYTMIRAVVHYGDLNVDNPQDAATLLSRIDNAAAIVCNGRWGKALPQVLAPKSEKCRRKAVADAVADLGAPEVTRALNAARS